jgi:integrase
VVPFTAAEVDALRAAAPAWFAVALDMGLGAGLRQSEATGLTVDRVDFRRRTLTVDRQL